MLRYRDREQARCVSERLREFHQTTRNLPGIQVPRRRETFVAQIIESIRRSRYVSAVRERDISWRRAEPSDPLFDPLKAAILFHRQGQLDEAYWMVFFFVHFGNHKRGGWRYARQVYGRLEDPSLRWSWAATSVNPNSFREWLHAHQHQIKAQGVLGGFGNHRKYQSLDAYSDSGTGAAFATYVQWIGPPRTHQELMDQAIEAAEGDPRRAFRKLYRSMNEVASFGRTARFDYLSMIAKLNFTKIEPDSTYMQGSTGPLKGARLLFGVQHSTVILDRWLVELEAQLGVGMQVLEDALCNWQKSPETFVPFRD